MMPERHKYIKSIKLLFFFFFWEHLIGKPSWDSWQMGGQRRSLEVLKFRQERCSTLCPANSPTVAQILTKLLTRGPHLSWPCIIWREGGITFLPKLPSTPEGFWLMPICPGTTYIKRKPRYWQPVQFISALLCEVWTRSQQPFQQGEKWSVRRSF